MKTINFKITDRELERLNYYRNTIEGGNCAQAYFIKEAIQEKCERVQQLRMGQLLMSFPNPDTAVINNEEKAQILEILKEADLNLTKVAPGVVDLSELIMYYNYHFFKMSDKQRKTFEDNLIKDLEFEAKLDEMKDSEGEES